MNKNERCPYCGSEAQFRIAYTIKDNNTMVQTNSCGCGYHKQIFWKKGLEVEHTNKKS